MFKDKVTKHSDTIGMYTVIVTRFCIQWGGCSQPKKTPKTPRTKVDIKSFATTTIDIVELRVRVRVRVRLPRESADRSRQIPKLKSVWYKVLSVWDNKELGFESSMPNVSVFVYMGSLCSVLRIFLFILITKLSQRNICKSLYTV